MSDSFLISTADPVRQSADLVKDYAGRQLYPASALYVVATPIGNLADITLRALHVFSLVDAIACEDTRNTAQMLQRYALRKPLIAAHLHNERDIAEKIVARLQSGERIALVSDAGTPAISDPGARIVDAVLAAGLPVIPLPGASAASTALSASGLIAEQFYFAGFLPVKSAQRQTALRQLSSMPATLVFYEAPHRIVETIDDLTIVLGPERQIVFARELTKLYEQIHRCRLADAAVWLKESEQHRRGEFVVLVEAPAPVDPQGEADQQITLSVQDLLQSLVAELPLAQAVRLAVTLTGLKKNRLYDKALALKNQAENGGSTASDSH